MQIYCDGLRLDGSFVSFVSGTLSFLTYHFRELSFFTSFGLALYHIYFPYWSFPITGPEMARFFRTLDLCHIFRLTLTSTE